jgi:hypothetical protein
MRMLFGVAQGLDAHRSSVLQKQKLMFEKTWSVVPTMAGAPDR